jgi:hypothetical protein
MNPLAIIFSFVFGVVVGGVATFKFISWLVVRIRILGFSACKNTDEHVHLFISTPWSTVVQDLPFGAHPEFVKLQRARQEAVPSSKSLEPHACDGTNVQAS